MASVSLCVSLVHLFNFTPGDTRPSRDFSLYLCQYPDGFPSCVEHKRFGERIPSARLRASNVVFSSNYMKALS